jgi:hypothetical protein
MEKLITIDSAHLKSILDGFSTSLVGKICKRMEIDDNIESIKKQAKEIIYEEARSLRTLLITFQDGQEFKETIVWNFKSKNESKEQQNGTGKPNS